MDTSLPFVPLLPLFCRTLLPSSGHISEHPSNGAVDWVPNGIITERVKGVGVKRQEEDVVIGLPSLVSYDANSLPGRLQPSLASMGIGEVSMSQWEESGLLVARCMTAHDRPSSTSTATGPLLERQRYILCDMCLLLVCEQHSTVAQVSAACLFLSG
ncbi:hypothetical protein C8Q76DRAFT_693828 [Earliella scabrosa]|nr:hypothetical protein C8Q76DRAFT_693828 [Earliella scabrosa]